MWVVQPITVGSKTYPHKWENIPAQNGKHLRTKRKIFPHIPKHFSAPLRYLKKKGRMEKGKRVKGESIKGKGKCIKYKGERVKENPRPTALWRSA